MKTRQPYDFATENARIIPLRAADLLEQEDSYDTNWLVSADDLFGRMDLPTLDYNPYGNLAA